MKIRSNARRMVNYFIHNSDQLLAPVFWSTLARVARARFNVWSRVSKQQTALALGVLDKRPWNLHVEVSNTCNANCIFCAYQYLGRKKQVMDMDLYRHVLDEYCRCGGGDFQLEVCVGEPLVDPTFLEKVRLARKRKEIRQIGTISNAILLGKRGIDDVLASGLDSIALSVGAFDSATYESLYRNSHYTEVRENVLNLLRRNTELGGPVDIKLCFRSNLGFRQTLALPDYQEMKQYPHKTEFNVDFDSWAGHIKAEDLLPGMHLRPQVALEREPCILLYDGPIVYVDGTVGACSCRDFNANSELIIGNIKEQSLLEIWTGERMTTLRERFRGGDFPRLCTLCTGYVNLDFYRSVPGIRRAKQTLEYLKSVE